jgi:hypothetical protein
MRTTMLIMRKTIYIFVVLLGFQFHTVYASVKNSETVTFSTEIVSGVTSDILNPVTPAEATFEDVAETNMLESYIFELAPVAPRVADFTDGAPAAEINSLILAPETPKEADFEDDQVTINTSANQGLPPVTPPVADFEDHE